MSKKVGLLDQDEKEALEGEKYALNKFFTPEQDADGNWVLPINQIQNNDLHADGATLKMPVFVLEQKNIFRDTGIYFHEPQIFRHRRHSRPRE